MFDPELKRAGIQRREDNYPDWRHADCAYRIPSKRRFVDHLYKHAESIPYLLAAFRARQ